MSALGGISFSITFTNAMVDTWWKIKKNNKYYNKEKGTRLFNGSDRLWWGDYGWKIFWF